MSLSIRGLGYMLRVHSEFEQVGLGVTPNEFMILQALVVAAGGMDRMASHAEIVDQVKKSVGKSFTKAYTYRCLHKLTEEGLVRVDLMHHPRLYSVCQRGLRRALENARRRRLRELKARRDAVEERVSALRELNLEEAAILITNRLIEGVSTGGSTVVEGAANVRSTVIREIAEEAKEGDVLRVMGYLSTVAQGMGPGGIADRSIIQSAMRGVDVRGLVVPFSDYEKDIDLLAWYFSGVGNTLRKTAGSGNIKLRICRSAARTYRIISLNEDKMVLYLTHSKESDIAALVYREDNPGLIDDAVSTFDSLWRDAEDVLEVINERIRASRST
ncbi:MAG: hypothetical protein ACP6KW_10485 [Candidatus Thorarchaeota archaeon]